MILDLLVMQPIDLCNLNCSYCYLPGRKNSKLMSDEVLEATFRSVFNSTLVEPIHESEKLKILWHSGEPLLAGIDFYKRAFNLLKKNNKKNILTSMEFQSNATPITQTWCDFIKENNFSIAVSIDGPQFLHDSHRKNWVGKGSYHLVMRGINCLKKNKIPLRGICVLTKDSLDYPDAIYEFFTSHGFESICFNVEEQECFNKKSSINDDHQKESIKEKYKNFMSIFYDRWMKDGRIIHVREFGSIIGTLKFRKKIGSTGYLPSSETLAFNIVTISKDGDISTFSPELSGGVPEDPAKFFIGNVLKIDNLDQVLENKNFKDQFASIKIGVEKCAQQCEYFGMCGGGSASNKYYENGSFETTETSVCVLSKKVLTDLIIEKLQAN